MSGSSGCEQQDEALPAFRVSANGSAWAALRRHGGHISADPAQAPSGRPRSTAWATCGGSLLCAGLDSEAGATELHVRLPVFPLPSGCLRPETPMLGGARAGVAIRSLPGPIKRWREWPGTAAPRGVWDLRPDCLLWSLAVLDRASPLEAALPPRARHSLGTRALRVQPRAAGLKGRGARESSDVSSSLCTKRFGVAGPASPGPARSQPSPARAQPNTVCECACCSC